MNKNILHIVVWVILISSSFGSDKTPLIRHQKRINIIYPKPNDIIGAVDSAFVIGNIPIESKEGFYKLFINGSVVDVYHTGGFIAFLPVTPGEFTFELRAYLLNKDKYKKKGSSGTPEDIDPEDILNELSYDLLVSVPEPIKSIPFDSLIIDSLYSNYQGHNVLNTPERLEVTFKGTPKCYAWFSIPGIIDSVPMVETNPQTQPYWGESVFGAGNIPESLLVEGVYTGFLDITDDMAVDSANIQFHLRPPSAEDFMRKFMKPPYKEEDIELLHFLIYNDSAKTEQASPYTFSINDPNYPFTVRFTDSVQIIRHGPRKGYFSIFQPEGVEALVVGKENEWYIAQISKTKRAWINENSVEKLSKGILSPHSYLSVVRYQNNEDNLLFKFPLSGKHPFRIIEEDRQTIKLQLFGVTSDTDWIRYDYSDNLVDYAVWFQPEENLYEFKIKLNSNIWGYDGYYDGNSFFLKINKPPDNLNSLKGKVIVVDPGHASDKGSVGPTGYTEAEANLGIALALKKKLLSKGAKVIMTRDDMSHVDLYGRPAIANYYNADLFVSIHNNALPDGVNPFLNNGSSTYYYHLHSIDLAKSIQGHLIDKVKLGDYGLYHGNLAVNRPTQYPAVLVECAFMIIPKQEELLKTDRFREKVADAITDGIKDFLKDFKYDY